MDDPHRIAFGRNPIIKPSGQMDIGANSQKIACQLIRPMKIVEQPTIDLVFFQPLLNIFDTCVEVHIAF